MGATVARRRPHGIEYEEPTMNSAELIAAVNAAMEERQRISKARPQSDVAPDDVENAHLDHEASKTLRVTLERQAEFANSPGLMVNLPSGRSGFQAQFVAPMVVREARRRGSAESAIQWLQKILTTEEARGIKVHTCWGLSPTEPITLTDRVTLVPFDQLPDSRQKTATSIPTWRMSPQVLPAYAWHPPTAALIVEVAVRPYLVDATKDPDESPDDAIAHLTMIDDVRLCLAMDGPRMIIPGSSWFQYLDPDLEAALLGAGWTGHFQEIQPIVIPESAPIDVDTTTTLVRSFLAMPSPDKDRLRTAMVRVHQALARRSPADKALELAIALETLLVDNPGEHTFKIGLRAALLTTNDLDGRIRNRATIAAMYAMRSALMHSGKSPATVKVRNAGDRPADTVVAEAVQIASNIVRRMITERHFPNWDVLELSPDRS
jgi:hypothetical protein